MRFLRFSLLCLYYDLSFLKYEDVCVGGGGGGDFLK